MNGYEWGVYKGHKAHLFPIGKDCVSSLCETAYSGDSGRAPAKNRKHCALCEKKMKQIQLLEAQEEQSRFIHTFIATCG